MMFKSSSKFVLQSFSTSYTSERVTTLPTNICVSNLVKIELQTDHSHTKCQNVSIVLV